MGVTHKAKAGALLTGTEWEGTDTHLEDVETVADAGATETLDLATAPVWDVTLTEACTFTLSGATSGQLDQLTVILRGAFATVWPGTVTWRNGPPTATAFQMVVLVSVDGGSAWEGYRVGAGDGTIYEHLTADETGKTDATLTNTGLSFSVTSGRYYRFAFDVLWRTTATSVGPKFGLTFPTVTRFGATVFIDQGSTGASGGGWFGAITASGGSITLTAVTAANTDYMARISGVIVPSATGTLMLQYAAETTGATVTMRQGSSAELIDLT